MVSDIINNEENWRMNENLIEIRKNSRLYHLNKNEQITTYSFSLKTLRILTVK